MALPAAQRSAAETRVINGGGIASSTTINSGSYESVNSGGTASGTTINSGGREQILSGGTGISTTIDSGGFEIVSSGGTASGTTINGGTLELASGASTSGSVTFTNAGGILQLDDSQHFHGLIAGFASPADVTEEIDLGDITFSKRTHLPFKENITISAAR